MGRQSGRYILAYAAVLAVLGRPGLAEAARPDGAVTLDYSNFSTTTGLDLNGAATTSGTVLRLAPASMSQAGSAFFTTPIDTTRSFGTRFVANMNGGVGEADGLTFVIQNDPDGTSVLGSCGGYMGYAYDAGTTGCVQGAGSLISPSVAVAFNIFNTDYVSFLTDGGSPPSGDPKVWPTGLYGVDQYVWIDYDATATLLSVYLGTSSTKPSTPQFTAVTDLASALGESAYVGFTAGTGGAYANFDLKSWQLENPPEVAISAFRVASGKSGSTNDYRIALKFQNGGSATETVSYSVGVDPYYSSEPGRSYSAGCAGSTQLAAGAVYSVTNCSVSYLNGPVGTYHHLATVSTTVSDIQRDSSKAR